MIKIKTINNKTKQFTNKIAINYDNIIMFINDVYLFGNSGLRRIKLKNKWFYVIGEIKAS